MRAILALAVSLLLSVSAIAQPGVITIRDDMGGKIFTYAEWYARVKEAGIPVRVEGLCVSACTIVLSLPKEQVCVTPTGSFGFHMVSINNEPDAEATAAMIRRFYPLPIRKWLMNKTLTNAVIYMSAAEAIALGVVKQCE